MTRSAADVLLEANAAVARGDHAGFLAHCTDDVVWHFIGDRTITGKAAIERFMDETYVHSPEVAVDRLIAEGEHLVAIGTITLIAADGTRTTSDYSDAWRLRDGKLAELHAFVIERT